MKTKAENWKNEYFTNLFLELSKHYLNIGYEYTRSSGKREFVFGEIPLVVCAGILAWRNEIWNSLFEIFSVDRYREKVIENLSHYNLRFNYNQGTVEKDFANIDYKYILEFGEIVDYSNFNETKTYYSLLKVVERYDIDISDQVVRCKENEAFDLHFRLLGEKYRNLDFDEQDIKRERDIEKITAKYTTVDFLRAIELFEIINSGEYKICEAISKVLLSAFQKTDLNHERILRKILKMKMQFLISYVDIFEIAIGKCGLDIVEQEILKFAKAKKLYLMRCFLQALPKTEINDHYVTLLKQYYVHEMKSHNKYRIDVELLKKFNEYEDRLLIRTINTILEHEKNRPTSRIDFFRIFGAKDIKKIIQYFESDPSLLKKLYLKMIKNNGHDDYKNKFLIYFFENEIVEVKEYLEFVIKQSNFSFKMSCAERLICLWQTKDYCGYVSEAVSYLIDSDGDSISKEEILRLIFISRHEKVDKNKQDGWIFEYIKSNSSDSQKIKGIFKMISDLSEERRLKHINELLVVNKDIELFKLIRLRPSSSGWSGSEIPIIDKEITYFEDVIKLLPGIEYIDHRKHIADKINCLKKYKRERKINEFLRDW